MIAVDTSALMAILLEEPSADACSLVLEEADRVLISTATIVEAFIVSSGRGLGASMAQLIDGFDFEVVTVTAQRARRAADAHARWGKGVHPAGLNFGDCFSYAVAEEYECGLLFIGSDFARTDIGRVLPD